MTLAFSSSNLINFIASITDSGLLKSNRNLTGSLRPLIK